MRLFVADLLMAVGAPTVVIGGLAMGAGPLALRTIGLGLGFVLLGYLVDWRSRTRALVGVAIAISWLNVWMTVVVVPGLLFAGIYRLVHDYRRQAL